MFSRRNSSRHSVHTGSEKKKTHHRPLDRCSLYCHQEQEEIFQSVLMPWPESLYISNPVSLGPRGIPNRFDAGVQQGMVSQVEEPLALSFGVLPVGEMGTDLCRW